MSWALLATSFILSPAASATSCRRSPMAKKTTLNEIGDMLAHIVKDMPTKDDIAALRTELKGDIANPQTQVNSIEQQLRETRIEVRLGSLEEKSSVAPVARHGIAH